MKWKVVVETLTKARFERFKTKTIGIWKMPRKLCLGVESEDFSISDKSIFKLKLANRGIYSSFDNMVTLIKSKQIIIEDLGAD